MHCGGSGPPGGGAQPRPSGGAIDRRKFMQAAGAARLGGLGAGAIPGYVVWKGSGDTASGASAAKGRPIKLGASLPLTDFNAPEGDLERKAIELAIEEANEGGGIAGRKVELTVLEGWSGEPRQTTAKHKRSTTDSANCAARGSTTSWPSGHAPPRAGVDRLNQEIRLT